MPEDFRIKASWATSHKRKMVQRRLGKPGVLAVVDLWSYAAQNKPDGDLSGMSNEAIAIAADWDGDADLLVASLTVPGFELLDGGPGSYILHDWKKHNPWVAGSDGRASSAAANAFSRHHREGRHTGRMVDGCPLCDPQCGIDANDEIRTAKSCDPQCGIDANDEIRTAPTPTPTPYPNLSQIQKRLPPARARHSADVDDSRQPEPPQSQPSQPPPPEPRPEPEPHTSPPAPVLEPNAMAPPDLAELERTLADAGIATQLSATDRTRWAMLHPVARWELEHAIQRATETRAKRASYVLGVVEGERKRAAECPEQPRARASPVRDIRVGWHPGTHDPEAFAGGIVDPGEYWDRPENRRRGAL